MQDGYDFIMVLLGIFFSISEGATFMDSCFYIKDLITIMVCLDDHETKTRSKISPGSSLIGLWQALISRNQKQ